MGTKVMIAVDLDEIVDLREQIGALKAKLAAAEAAKAEAERKLGQARKFEGLYLDLKGSIEAAMRHFE